jgi:hypothetical protein
VLRTASTCVSPSVCPCCRPASRACSRLGYRYGCLRMHRPLVRSASDNKAHPSHAPGYLFSSLTGFSPCLVNDVNVPSMNSPAFQPSSRSRDSTYTLFAGPLASSLLLQCLDTREPCCHHIRTRQRPSSLMQVQTPSNILCPQAHWAVSRPARPPSQH